MKSFISLKMESQIRNWTWNHWTRLQTWRLLYRILITCMILWSLINDQDKVTHYHRGESLRLINWWWRSRNRSIWSWRTSLLNLKLKNQKDRKFYSNRKIILTNNKKHKSHKTHKSIAPNPSIRNQLQLVSNPKSMIE